MYPTPENDKTDPSSTISDNEELAQWRDQFVINWHNHPSNAAIFGYNFGGAWVPDRPSRSSKYNKSKKKKLPPPTGHGEQYQGQGCPTAQAIQPLVITFQTLNESIIRMTNTFNERLQSLRHGNSEPSIIKNAISDSLPKYADIWLVRMLRSLPMRMSWWLRETQGLAGVKHASAKKEKDI